MENKNILIIVTGSIAAYKACEVIRILRKEGAEVQVMMTKSSLKFIGKTTFSALSNPMLTTLIFVLALTLFFALSLTLFFVAFNHFCHEFVDLVNHAPLLSLLSFVGEPRDLRVPPI